ncbi:unnamed protein product [Thelazia callipaeda]|uniref:Major sperm protein n=1 Tax=Thelazia callipaeda TaxID=103827 RepID=A0A0N5D5F7_THECL|nr:unnamed protein product [Thelazia callipaeda]
MAISVNMKHSREELNDHGGQIVLQSFWGYLSLFFDNLGTKFMTDMCTIVNGNEFDLTELEMMKVEKQTNWRQWFIVCSAVIAVYLIHGEHAKSVCNISTTLPAAFFTYKQLSDQRTRIFAYKATLFYWSIHGILIAFDNVFTDTFGYFFGKFVLLLVLFFNIIYQYDMGRNVAEQHKHNTATNNSKISTRTGFLVSSFESDMSLDTTMVVTDNSQLMIRVNTFNQHILNILQDMLFKNDNFSPLSLNSTKSTLMTACSSLAHSTAIAAVSNTSLAHDASLKSVCSVKGQRFNEMDIKTAEAQLSAMTGITVSEGVNQEMIKDVTEVAHSDECQLLDCEAKFSALDPNASYVPDKATEEKEMLVTDPVDCIVFKLPYNDSVTICVTNKYSCPIMWALKTNAILRMIAQPTCGTLEQNATVHIKIGMTSVPPQDSGKKDRVAIDYCLIDNHTDGTDRSFLYKLQGPLRKRKKFEVYYEV